MKSLVKTSCMITLLGLLNSAYAGQFFIQNNCPRDITLSVVKVGSKNCTKPNRNPATLITIPQGAAPVAFNTDDNSCYTVQLAYGFTGAQICRAPGKGETVTYQPKVGIYKGCYCVPNLTM